MTNQEFDALAERILCARLQCDLVAGPTEFARFAVEAANALVMELNQRREKLRTTTLTPEEVRLIESRRAILAIKSVRERTGLSLKDAKAVVDRAREGLGL